jgi:hypothetical protein
MKLTMFFDRSSCEKYVLYMFFKSLEQKKGWFFSPWNTTRTNNKNIIEIEPNETNFIHKLIIII